MGLDISTLQPIHVGFTNCYPIDTGQGLALIDTGSNTDQLWGLLTTGLKELGYDVSQARWILLTHAHEDHSGLAGRVKEVSGAEILIHQEEAVFLLEGGAMWSKNSHNFERLYTEHGVPKELLEWYYQRGRRAGWFHNWKKQPVLFERNAERSLRRDIIRALDTALEESASTPEANHAPMRRRGDEDRGAWQPMGIEPDRTIADDEVLELGALRLRAIQTPGHTPGHVCYYQEESQVLFTGDHILKRITPHPGLYFLDNSYENRTKSLPLYMRSLLRLRSLPCRRVLAAHEGEMNNLEYAVDRIIWHHERRARSAMRAVRLGRSTAFRVLPILFPHLRASALSPALDETIAHLDLLEEQGQVRVGFEDGAFRYWPTEA